MANGFTERVGDACVTRGFPIGDACAKCCMPLAKRCGVPVKRVENWFATEGESMTARERDRLAEVLHTRGRYLQYGTGPVTPLALSPLTMRVMLLMDSLPPDRAETWIGIAEDMVRGH